ncbi:MAG TPA: molybdopterin-dependent oxidoreductase [Nitrospiria bacterium]|nr:molybdopterin-dependent oxidoreductase [Nitrospiria bacterium]
MAKPTFTVGEEKAAKPIIEVTIDGEKVTAPEGTSIYDVVIHMGKTLPSMCYHYTFSPFGSCGICLVEVEGKKSPVRSCTAPITPNMVVRTQEKSLWEAQKKAIEKHLTTHPLDCPVCDADGRCELQDMSYEFGISQLGPVKQKGIPEDTRSIVLDFNMNRCILCGECINICKEVQMVDALQFLKKDGHTHVVAKGDTALYCEFCGDCLEVCPVGAITNKFSKYVYKPWQLKTTTTTCPYCGDGCILVMDTQGNQVVRVRSRLTWKSKWGEHEETVHGHGGICGRARFGFQFINSKERLSQPLIRKEGKLVETPWFVASSYVAQRLNEIKTQYGGQAIAGLITARCTNEDMYLFQKFMRIALGTNHIDSSARYGHINFILAMKKALGAGRGMATYADLTLANVILVIGSDITETNPVAALRVKEALRNYGGKVIVVDPPQTNMAKLATHHLAIKPGSERALIQGLIKVLVEQGLVDAEFAKKYPDAVDRIKEVVAGISLESIQSETGIEPAKLQEVTELFAKAKKGIIICGEGILRRARGYEHTLLLIDLAMLAGKLEKPGCGITAMCEENNEQGAVEMGVVPEFLPGQLEFSDPVARQKYMSAWGDEIPARPGDTLLRILERAGKGEIKALYLVGENPLGTLPASVNVREALERVSASGGFIVCQDLFLTETGRLADAVLPACSFAEKEGTFTNFEGKINPVSQALEYLGESKADWEILTEISGAMGYPLAYVNAEEIRQEISRLLPGFMGDRSERPQVHLDRYLSNGFAQDLGRRYSLLADGPGRVLPEYPFVLVLGQVLYHSGKLTTRAEGLMKIFDKRLLQISPVDAERLGVAGGEKVRVRSAQGFVEVGVELNPMFPAGMCFFPEHFNEPPVRDLIPCETDPITSAPYHKFGRVAIEKLG